MVISYRSRLNVLEPILLVESCIIIAVNAFGLFVIFKSKSLTQLINGQKKLILNQVIIFCLFISHLCLGVVQFCHATTIIAGTSDEDKYNIPNHFKVFLCSLEIMFTIVLSVERFMAVKFPFYYTRHEKTIGRILFTIVIFLSFTALTLFLFYKKLVMIPVLVTFLGGIVIFVSNVSLYRIVKQQRRKILCTMVHNSDEKQNEESKTIKKKQLKSLKVCVSMTATYVVLWVPFVTVSLLNVRLYSVSLTKIASILEPFGYLNAICDVLIYLVMHYEAVRRIFKKSLRCCARTCLLYTSPSPRDS